jgi:hypothetical protein
MALGVKDYLHYGSGGLLILVGSAAWAGIPLPGVEIHDPGMVVMSGVGILAAGLKGGWTSGAAILLAGFLMTGSPAAAQTAPAPSCNPQTIFTGLTFANLAARVKQCASDDLNAAIKDAQTNNDQAALACLQPFLNMVASVQNGGLFIAFQQFRDAKKSLTLANCANYVNSTITPQ